MPLGLKVPWYQKQQALAAGGEQDPASGLYIFPDEVFDDLIAYERWFPLKEPDLVLTYIHLFSTTAFCPACGWPTTIYGLCTLDYYIKETYRNETDWGYWGKHLLLYDIAAMDKPMAKQLARSAPTFFKDRDPLSKAKEWMNHCTLCGHIIRNELLYGWEGYFIGEFEDKQFEERVIEAPFGTFIRCSHGHSSAAQIISDNCYRRYQ